MNFKKNRRCILFWSSDRFIKKTGCKNFKITFTISGKRAQVIFLCRLFKNICPAGITLFEIWDCFGLVGFYAISNIVCYLMPNPLYTLISNIYDLVWSGFMPHQGL